MPKFAAELALISLVATPAAIAAAEEMDATFWHSTLRMEKLGAFDEASWSEIVQDAGGIAAEACPTHRLVTSGADVAVQASISSASAPARIARLSARLAAAAA